MKKYLIYVFLLINSLMFSQIKFTTSITKLTDNNKYILKIKLVNESKENYAIPIDTTGFRAYYSPQVCNKSDYPDKYFSPIVIFRDHVIFPKNRNI